MAERKLWNEILRMRDELRLQLHLAGMDAKDAFSKLDDRIEAFSQKAEKTLDKVGEETKVTLAEMEAELKKLREKIEAKQKS